MITPFFLSRLWSKRFFLGQGMLFLSAAFFAAGYVGLRQPSQESVLYCLMVWMMALMLWMPSLIDEDLHDGTWEALVPHRFHGYMVFILCQGILGLLSFLLFGMGVAHLMGLISFHMTFFIASMGLFLPLFMILMLAHLFCFKSPMPFMGGLLITMPLFMPGLTYFFGGMYVDSRAFYGLLGWGLMIMPLCYGAVWFLSKKNVV